MHSDYWHSNYLLLLLHHKEHFLLSTTCQYWSIYLLKDLLQGRGKLRESHLLELTQVWTGKQQRGRKYGMQLCVTPQLNVFVRAHAPLSQVEINGKLLTEELIFRVLHDCLQEEKEQTCSKGFSHLSPKI